MDKLIKDKIDQLHAIHSGRLWTGTNYEGRLVQLSDQKVFNRPLNNLHSVAEILGHIIAWRNDALLKIRNGTGRLLDSDPENWPSNEELKEVGWKSLLESFNNSLIELTEELKKKKDSFLHEKYYDQDFKEEMPYSFMLDGLIHHDLYHLGQLGIVIKLLT